MKKSIAIASLLAFISLGQSALAAPSFTVVPFEYDPGNACNVVAEYQDGNGLPDAGGTNFALLLRKGCTTATNAAAVADIVSPLEGGPISALTELGFDVKSGTGHCGAGAPRFNVQVDGNYYFLGCIYGTHSPIPGRPNWEHIVFGLADFALAGIPLTGTLDDLAIVFDEGTDTPVGGSINTPGRILIDNINVNGEILETPVSPPAISTTQLSCILKTAPFNTAVTLNNIACKSPNPLSTFKPLADYCKLANAVNTYKVAIPSVPASQTDFTKLCLKAK